MEGKESPAESSQSSSLKTGSGEELSEFQRGTVVGCYLCKKTIREIAAMLDVPRTTVNSVIVKWKRDGFTSTLTRKTRKEHRQVLEKVAQESCLPSAKTASGAQVSSKTVRREKSKYCKSAGEEKMRKDQEMPVQEEAKDDVSHLDLRVGRIITAVKFSDSDGLYMKHVDIGEAFFRTVVTELPQHFPLDKMQNRMVVVLCNLKPVSTRGVESQALLLCARSPDKVEILDPPSGAVPGDRVIFMEFPGEPDAELKQTVWEQLQKDLRTNSQCVATYRGAAFEVEGKGVCTVQTLSDGEIK